MTKKVYDSSDSLRKAFADGVQLLCKNVAATYGPRGRNVILHAKDHAPVITKDGATVAKFVESDNPFENLAIGIIKQAASQTAKTAGDGTTTATILAKTIVDDAFLTVKKHNPILLKRGMDAVTKIIVERIKELSIPIRNKDDIYNIATISANGDTEIGDNVAKAIDAVGRDGSVSIVKSKTNQTELELIDGFRLDSGLLSPKFVTDPRRNICRLENPYILVTDERIELVDEILPVLEQVAREQRSLLIVAEDISGQALAALIMNAIRGTMKVAAVKAPKYGEERREILKDLSISVGADLVSLESDLTTRMAKLPHLGRAKTIEIGKYGTTIVGARGLPEDLEARILDLKEQIKQEEDVYEAERIQERVVRLSSAVAIIKVGGSTDAEVEEKKFRYEDSLEAVLSAISEGIAPGGGTTFLHAVSEIDTESMFEGEELIGAEIVKQACSAPFNQLAWNAGFNLEEVLSSTEEFGQGINFLTGERVNMIESGIIDPAKVLRCALENAVSAASILMTSEYGIVEV